MSSTFFGFQIAVASPPGDPWRARLVGLIRANQKDLSILEKRVLYTELADLLAESAPHWTLGTWDYVTGPRGEREFDEWVAGVEETADEPIDPASPNGDHAVVSVMLLVEDGSKAQETLGGRCDVPESAWKSRATYQRIVASLRMLVFSGVLADGVYVVPGDVERGMPFEELRAEGWEYLDPLV